MPTYSYQCNSCGIMDIHQSIYDSVLTRCPACNSKQFVKKIGSAGIQFKGKGFYSTDSKDK
jgi:putative FmdB family regulatory protein